MKRANRAAGAFRRIGAVARLWSARARHRFAATSTSLVWGAAPVCLAVLIQARQKLPKRSLEELGASLISAMAGLVILLVVLILLVWLGGRFARHYMEDSGPSLPSITWARRQDDWADAPLPDEGDKPDDEK